jgi:ATP-dependent protease ClpP protease subunit
LTFWVNFVLLFFALNALERFTFPPYFRGEWPVTIAVVTFFVLVRVIIYPWQITGLIRCCGHHINSNINRTWVTAAQGVAVLSIAATLVATLESYQSLAFYKKSLLPAEYTLPEPEYSLNLVSQESLIHLQGPFEVGITRTVTALVKNNPQVTGIVLDSIGGQIYEGRGLARMIRENSLDTYTTVECLSACTTAFVAGAVRTLGKNARLGFHQYKTYSVIPSINVKNEQAKDREIFRKQGVSPEFLNKIFDTTPEDMWFPKADELLRANIIHRSGFSFDRQQ